MVEIQDQQTDMTKQYVTILFEDKDTRVSWYADTDIEDTRFALICACDSLCDSEFELLDSQAKPIDINSLNNIVNGSIYFLRRKQTNKPTKIMLDGKRKLLVQIEPLRHLEAQVAIRYLLIGSNLLKHSAEGFPHIRLFQVSTDLRRILWYTKDLSLSDSQVAVESITDITLGQISENFIRYPLKILEEFSFSIYYKSSNSSKINTLDLTCKDEREYDLWVIGIKALFMHFSNKIICKNDLLLHSKSYNEACSKGNIANCSKLLVYDDHGTNKNSSTENKSDSKNPKNKTLEKFIVSRNLNQRDIANLFIKLNTKIKDYKDEVANVLEEEGFKTGEPLNKEYEMIFNDDAIVDDLETQKSQMIKLYTECESNIGHLLQEFLWYANEHKFNTQCNIGENDYEDFIRLLVVLDKVVQNLPHLDEKVEDSKINPEFFLKELDIKLWKIEVDLENVGDIINRFKFPKKDAGFLDKVKNIFIGV